MTAVFEVAKEKNKILMWVSVKTPALVGFLVKIRATQNPRKFFPHRVGNCDRCAKNIDTRLMLFFSVQPSEDTQSVFKGHRGRDPRGEGSSSVPFLSAFSPFDSTPCRLVGWAQQIVALKSRVGSCSSLFKGQHSSFLCSLTWRKQISYLLPSSLISRPLALAPAAYLISSSL